MATVLQLRERLKPLLSRETVYGILFDVIRSFEAYLVDLNQKNLEQGADIFGLLLGTYSRATEIESLFGDGPRPIKPKTEGEPYNFQWTGDLFGGMKLVIENNVAYITSDTPYTPELLDKYGEIFGLTDIDLAEAIQTRIGPGFIKSIRSTLLV